VASWCVQSAGNVKVGLLHARERKRMHSRVVAETQSENCNHLNKLIMNDVKDRKGSGEYSWLRNEK